MPGSQEAVNRGLWERKGCCGPRERFSRESLHHAPLLLTTTHYSTCTYQGPAGAVMAGPKMNSGGGPTHSYRHHTGLFLPQGS